MATLSRGEIPIHEPGLAGLVAAGRAGGRLVFTADVAAAAAGADVALLCVGTPPRDDGHPDLRQVAAAAAEVSRAATGDLVLAVKSTVPPGTCEALELIAAEAAPPGVRVTVVSNPEFLREGRAVTDFFHPDRVVVGADDQASGALVAGLYPPRWTRLRCDRRSAELIKYAANTFLAVKISFANEIAGLCEELGADATPVLAGVGLDQRVGPDFLAHGPGFGGSCLGKDLSGLIHVGAALGLRSPIARAAQEVNAWARTRPVDKLEGALGPLAGRRVAVLGLAFKPGTDDVRDSPAVSIVASLLDRGADVRTYDPVAAGPAAGRDVRSPGAGPGRQPPRGGGGRRRPGGGDPRPRHPRPVPSGGGPAAGVVPGPGAGLMALVLVRHGESTWNAAGLLTGWGDPPLTARGRAQARQAGGRLAAGGAVVDVVHTSALRRARQTAGLLLAAAGQPQVPVRADWRWNERHWGALEGLTKADVVARWGNERRRRWRDDPAAVPPPLDAADPRHPALDPRYRRVAPGLLPAGESLQCAAHRVLGAWHELAVRDLDAGRTVVLVGHQAVLTAVAAHVSGAPLVETGGARPWAHCALVRVDDRGRPRCCVRPAGPDREPAAGPAAVA